MVVTGSPNDLRLLPRTNTAKKKVYRVSQMYDAMRWFTPKVPIVASQDPELLNELQHEAGGASSWTDLEAWSGGMPLADMECPHGHLPEDRRISCQCWGLPPAQILADLREARKALSERVPPVLPNVV